MGDTPNSLKVAKTYAQLIVGSISRCHTNQNRVLITDAIRLVVVSFNLLLLITRCTPSEGWGHGKKPWSPRCWETSQGLDQRS